MFKSLARSAVLGILAGAAGATGLALGGFALYVALKGTALGQAGAAAVVAVIFLAVAFALSLALRGKPDAHKHEGPSSSGGGGLPFAGGGDLMGRAVGFAQQRPLIAGGVGILAAFYLLRNPALLTGLIGLAAGRQEGRQEIKRGWF